MQGLDTRNSPSSTSISRNLSISSQFGSVVSHMSRLVRDHQGTYIFFGPSANLSMLQTIRKIVHRALGPSNFREVPAEDDLVDEEAVSIEGNDTVAEPSRPSVADARYYLQWYTSTTSCVFDLFGHQELAEEIIPWLEKPASTDPQTCINFLVLAIGAQCGPRNCDDQANEYFTYARSLSSKKCLDAVSIATVQIYCLVATYLLNAARPHAASMHLGLAVRAAHSLGIQRADINALFAGVEGAKRERIWKVLRVQDLFLSTSLGQQPSTKETRETMWPQGYSASTDLCHIFEKILSEVYSKQEVSPAVLENVSKHHREWASRFREGLLTDHIPAEGDVGAREGQNQPNIGLCHLKEAYYWTIMLVTRPYLIDLVQRHMAYETDRPRQASTNDDVLSPQTQQSDTLLAHASVNSAVLTIDLLQCFLLAGEIPKRLPYVVNSILNSALVLGIGYFAGLDRLFPLGHALDLAERLLGRFQSSDPLAQWSLRIVRDLRCSCNEFVRRRCDRHLKRQRALVEGLFGDVKPLDSQARASPISPSSPCSLPQGWNIGSENGDSQDMTQTQFLELPSDLQIEENSTIWSQLFRDSIPGSLWESDLESGGGLPFEWP
ncbi:hypothetical protein N7474_008032 [Penicillium riverlandense]|uniref:uncharacterized protein n=1 Tax=Penicillium riverlandense TaxID=1903569 RepID=UPI00254970EE|nr:uncharacterized protein N7474_008032 [Penicillium riverlandense]KAJ5811731.1 hypothetical protein N7474_008032 [Penicillium riverlandense]